MLGAKLGLPVAHPDSHASYIEQWRGLLKNDDRAILTAAARAEEATSLLLKLGGRTTLDDDTDDIGDAHGDDTDDDDDWEFELEWLRDDLVERARAAFPSWRCLMQPSRWACATGRWWRRFMRVRSGAASCWT
jgi:hypothetical protein